MRSQDHVLHYGASCGKNSPDRGLRLSPHLDPDLRWPWKSYRREWVIDPNKCHYLVCGCIEFDCGRTDVRTDVPTYRRTFLPGLLGHLGGDDLKMACVLLYSALSANEQNKEKQLSTCFIVIVTVSNSSCSDVINIVYCNYSISIRLRSVCEVINFHSMLNCRTCY